MPIEELPAALTEIRTLILDGAHLVRAIASGRRRGYADVALPRRVEFRPVDVRGQRVLQVVRHGPVEMRTDNYPLGEAAQAVDELIGEPFGNWHVVTDARTVQLRVTKKGQAQIHRAAAALAAEAGESGEMAGAGSPDTAQRYAHDRAPQHLLAPDDPIFTVLGADADKRRQVDAFLRNLQAVLPAAIQRAEAANRPLRVVDLGCGNAYLTFAAHRWLSTGPAAQLGVTTVGVELREALVTRSTKRAADAGLNGLQFVTGTIQHAEPFESGQSPDVVLALHACDTATDEALARAVKWQAPVVLAAPCCHQDIQRQLSVPAAPEPYGAIIRHPILRERFADVLTDTLRALILRQAGYRVEVVEFVDSRHTPRNAMIRAVAGGGTNQQAAHQLAQLVSQWGVTPALTTLLTARDS